MPMTKRERYLTALIGGQPDVVPRRILFVPHVARKIKEAVGCESIEDFFDMEKRNVWLNPTKDRPGNTMPSPRWAKKRRLR